MRSLLLVVLVVGVCSAGLNNIDISNSEAETFIEKTLSKFQSGNFQIENLISRQKIAQLLKATLVHHMAAKGNQARIPILTPITVDPLPIEPFSQTFAPDSEFAFLIQGTFAISGEDAQVAGTSTVVDDFNVVFQEVLRAIYNISVEDITATGEHAVDLTILDPLVRIVSNGEFSANVVSGVAGFELNLPVDLTSTDPIALTSVALTLNFDSITISTTATEVTFLETTYQVDWASVNENIKPGFDLFWPLVAPVLEEGLRSIANEIIGGCTWPDIFLGDFSCLTTSDPNSTSTTSDPNSTSTTTEPSSTPNKTGHIVSFDVLLLVSVFALGVSRYYL